MSGQDRICKKVSLTQDMEGRVAESHGNTLGVLMLVGGESVLHHDAMLVETNRTL